MSGICKCSWAFVADSKAACPGAVARIGPVDGGVARLLRSRLHLRVRMTQLLGLRTRRPRANENGTGELYLFHRRATPG